MECPNCSADVSERAKFCSQCGSALPLRCPSCANSNAPGSKFCYNCGTSLAGTSGTLPITEFAPSMPPRAVLAERCHLTVMFCDLVVSTALSVHLDVEDFQEVIAAYQKRVAEIVTRFGGFVARRVGDGVLVYFGYPNADEDDPEQAMRAGLAVVEAVGLLESREPLQVRLGIATGLGGVGDLFGCGTAQRKGGFGRGAESRRSTASSGGTELDRDRREHAPAGRIGV